MSYQDRVDIDKLYGLVWDYDANQPLFLSKEEFEVYKQHTLDRFFDKSTSDGRYSPIDHIHNNLSESQATEVQSIATDVVSGQVDLSGYLKMQ